MRLTQGSDLEKLAHEFGSTRVEETSDTIHNLVSSGLMAREGKIVRLTPRGRLVSNEVFERFLVKQ